MTTGEKIKALRKKLNMTQEAFADSIKVSRRSIMDWEHDKYTPQTESLMEICKVHHVDLSYFLDEEKEDEEEKKEDTPVEVIKNNVIVTSEEKKNYKNKILKEKKVYSWYRIFKYLTIWTPIIIFIICMVNEKLIDYLVYPFMICPIIFYILFRRFRENYCVNVFDKLRTDVNKKSHAIQYDYPLYAKINDDTLAVIKSDKLLLNVPTSDIKHIALFLNNSLMKDLLPLTFDKVYFITMEIYFNDGNKVIVSVDYDPDTKLTKAENNINKQLLIANFNKIYVKYKK